MNRTSKITWLPETLREELNQRLRNGEPAHIILPWLNKLPEVIALVEEHYGGNLISPQNLSDWNLGGYREWLTRQEMRESSQDFAAEAPHLTAAAGGSLLQPLTTAIHARYGALLAKMPLDAEVPKAIQSQLDASSASIKPLSKIAAATLLPRKTPSSPPNRNANAKRPTTN